MGSSHSMDGRTIMNSFDATVNEQQTSSNQENFSEGRRCRQAPADSEEKWCLRAPGRGENIDKEAVKNMGKKEFQEKCSTEPVGGLKNRQARASKDKQGGKKDFKKKGGDRKIVREEDVRSHGDPKMRLRAFMGKQKAERS